MNQDDTLLILDFIQFVPFIIGLAVIISIKTKRAKSVIDLGMYRFVWTCFLRSTTGYEEHAQKPNIINRSNEKVLRRSIKHAN